MLRQGRFFAVLVALLVFIAQESAVSCDRAARVLAGVKSRRLWKTLKGQEPVVIARGGLSGLFPDHTSSAYQVALNNSLPNVVIFCDLQLTEDGGNVCRTGLNLENSTNIADIFKNRTNTYMVNGESITGYFSVDFTAEEILSRVLAKQAVLSRPPNFDYNLPVLPVEGLNDLNPPALWLNVQYSKFYEERKLSTIQYVLSAAKSIRFEYISSPEVEFLRRIRLGLRKSKSKLVLRFLGKEDIEPSTNQTYGTLLNNLTSLKSYASGILLPKEYIWPLSDGYIHTPTTIVQDAHKAGLEVYASDFANDEFGMSYNYSYDPVREYLQFVDNPEFSVDGVLTDFSVTASEAIACYAHNKKNISSNKGRPLIITYNGASGDFPGCTDLAYQGAIKDGADYIDCSVQMTKDGVAICRESPDLTASTNVLSDSSFYPSRLTQVSDIQKDKGIFTFNFMWKEIQGLKPQIGQPFPDYDISRNPAYMNVGQFMTLSDFLKLAKGQANVGVLINIQHARYLASKQGLDVINATQTALEKAGYGNMTNRVMIQSEDSAVLQKFRQQTAYKLVYQIKESDVSVPDSTIKEIKGFADAVTLSRTVVLPVSEFFLMDNANIVSRMHLNNLTVFISRLRNEFPSLAFDYLADPTMEINTFVNVAKPDGLFTEFPATAKAYLNNACRQPTSNSEYSMFLVEPGALLAAMPPAAVPPPTLAPALTDVIEPPLPSVSVASPTPAPTATQNSTSSKNGQPNISCHFTLSLVFSASILVLLSWN